MSISLEHVLTHYYKDGMISYMQNHPKAFDEAIELAVSDKQPYAWRAAWLLWSVMEENDLRIKNRIDDIIREIPSKKDGHKRELLKILYVMALNEEQEGHVFNICSGIWEQINKVPSIRFMAFKFILKIAKKYPELHNEIAFFTQAHYIETLSPGIKNGLLKLLKQQINN